MEEKKDYTRIPIEKGWSADQKYKVIATDGAEYFLRILSDRKRENLKEMYQLLQKAADLGIDMCRPLAFGNCAEGEYLVEPWVEGMEAEEEIPGFSEERQTAYGLQAGRMLKKLHSIPAPEWIAPWEIRMNAKIDRIIRRYRECPLFLEGAEEMIACIETNRHLLKERPQTFQHGDYHIGNMMLKDGRLIILDFDRYDFGDPWEEFNRITWCAQAAPAFAAGMINGYFEFDVPQEFWRLLILYISSNLLASLPWAIPFGEQEITTMRRQAKDVCRWYDGMHRIVPDWYTA